MVSCSGKGEDIPDGEPGGGGERVPGSSPEPRSEEQGFKVMGSAPTTECTTGSPARPGLETQGAELVPRETRASSAPREVMVSPGAAWGNLSTFHHLHREPRATLRKSINLGRHVLVAELGGHGALATVRAAGPAGGRLPRVATAKASLERTIEKSGDEGR